MKHFFVFFLILAYILSTGFLENRLISRVVLADILLVGLMLITFIQSLNSKKIIFTRVHASAFPLLILFLFSAVFSKFPDKAGLELLVVLFSFIGSICLVNMLLSLNNVWAERFFSGYVLILGALSFACLLDYFVFPGIFPNTHVGGLAGSFRNTGQAGSFFGLHFAFCLALLISGVVPRRPIYVLATFLVVLALTFTLKRASSAAVVSGLLFLTLQMLLSNSTRDKQRAIGFLVIGGILAGFGTLFFQWALENTNGGLAWKFGYKYSSNTISNFTNGFFAENLSSTFEALNDRPLIGVGLGNVTNVYQSHEIHSTYLAVIAYSGLLGVIFYVIFMYVFLQTILSGGRDKNDNKWASFLYTLFPLALGQMIGWGYTYHIRKREFWIMVFFVVAARHLSMRNQRQSTDLRMPNSDQ